jgi:hypothetical protein
MKRSKGKQPVKPGPSKKARREPAPPVHTRRTRATAARQASDHVPHTNRREDTESPLPCREHGLPTKLWRFRMNPVAPHPRRTPTSDVRYP